MQQVTKQIKNDKRIVNKTEMDKNDKEEEKRKKE